MTDAVKEVSAQTVKYEDGQYRRSRLDRLKARALKTSRDARSVFKQEKAEEYKRDIPELTNRQARSFGKKTMQNERAAARVDDRMVYIDENKMNALKSAMPDYEHVYIDNEKVRQIIAENPEDFYVDGEFSSDQYKRRFGGFTGFDNKANLDEIATASADYGVNKKTIRKAMKYAGYDTEKDLTWLYKTLAALGVLGASAGTGALLGASFTSNVWGVHNDGSSELLDTIKTTSNAAEVGALRGLLAGVIPAIALAAVVKDNGGKDIFKGNTAEEIVAKGEKNIESRIKGEKNQKMMKAILKMPNISDEDKAFILKLAYGELTGKKVNDRELAAAYEIAKFCNAHPDFDPKDYDKLPGRKGPDGKVPEDKPDKETKPIDQNRPTTPVQPVKPALCDLSIGKIDGVKAHDYIVRAGIKGKDKDGNPITLGDNPYNIVMGKYKRADGKPMTHKDIMAVRNEIFGEGKGLRQGKIQLLDELTVNGVPYKYQNGKVELGTVAKGGKMNFFKPVNYPGASYNVHDCNNNILKDKLPDYDTAKKEAERIAKENPNKYNFFIQ